MRWVLEKAAPEKADGVASKFFNFRKLRGCGALSRESMIINRRLSVTKEDDRSQRTEVGGRRSEIRKQGARRAKTERTIGLRDNGQRDRAGAESVLRLTFQHEQRRYSAS